MNQVTVKIQNLKITQRKKKINLLVYNKMQFDTKTILIILAIILLFYFMSNRKVEVEPKKEKYCPLCK